MSSKKDEIDLSKFFKNFKINYSLILMIVFLIFGFFLRVYHIEYPMIGYHNWKSAHYITEARNFANEGFFKEGFFVPMRDTMSKITEPPSGAHKDTFPTDPIIIGFLFKIFGESIKIARFVEICFSLGSIVFFYLFIKELFNNEKLALLIAFLATINPMFVFFTHNVQLVNSALFFMLTGLYFYARWLKDINKSKNMYIAAFFIALSSMTKYTFAVIAVPILFSFPYKKILKKPKKFYKVLGISFIIILMFPAWLVYSEFVVKQQTIGHLLTDEQLRSSYSFSGLIDLGMVADKNFWQTIRLYVADNFTLIGINMFILGSIFLCYVFLLKKNRKQHYRFMFGYFLSLFVFFFIMGFKLSGHNYHQFPIAPYVLFAIAFLAEFISENIKQFVPKNIKSFIFPVVALLIVILLWQPSQAARDRMYNTQFPGLDVAGNYIRQNSQPNERIFHSSGQNYGVLWHSGRKGYKGSSKVEVFEQAEEEYNVTWIFAYQWGIQTYFQNPEVFQHIKDNYRLVQFAYVANNNQVQPIYFLFKKGGTFNDTNLNEMLQEKPTYKTTYHYTHGTYDIMHINLE